MEKMEEVVDDLADGKAAVKAEEGEESSEAATAPFRRTRMESRKKIMNTQRKVMRMYNQMTPMMNEDQMMEILPMQMSPNAKGREDD